MKKQLLASMGIALSLCLALTACGGGGKSGSKDKQPAQASGSGAANDGKPAHYRIMIPVMPQFNGDFKDMPIVKQITQEAGVEIEFEQVGDAAAQETKNIAISTGNMPDAFLGLVGESDIRQNRELFMVLNDAVEKYPNVSKLLADNPEAKQFLRFDDGNIYSFPFVQERDYETFPDQLWLNKAWLDKLNLKTPETLDEFADVLRAFKTKDPNGNGEADEVPLSMMLTHNYFGFYSLYGLFGRVDEPSHLAMENKKIVFTADKDEWKEATKWFAGLYKEGLLDEEGFTQDRSSLFAKGKAETPVIGAVSAFLIENVVGLERAKQYENVVLKGKDGKKFLRYSEYPIQSRTNSVINAKLQNPEPLLRFFDTCLDQSKNYPLQTVFGLIGKQIEETGDNKKPYRFATPPDGLGYDEYRYQDAPARFPTYLTRQVWESIEHAEPIARKEAILEANRDNLQKDSIPPILFTDEEGRELADITSAINDFVKQQQSLWITGQSDIDADWESYKQRLNDMGLTRMLEIYQQATDRYFKN